MAKATIQGRWKRRFNLHHPLHGRANAYTTNGGVPEETVLYQLVQEHAETFFAQVEAETGVGVPDIVKEEFDALLECGILANGFLRARCEECAHEKLEAFSCKKTRFLPLLWCTAHGGDRRPSGGSRYPPHAGAPMGVIVSDSTAIFTGRPSPPALAGLAGRQPRHLIVSDQTGGIGTCAGRHRRRHLDSAFWRETITRNSLIVLLPI